MIRLNLKGVTSTMADGSNGSLDHSAHEGTFKANLRAKQAFRRAQDDYLVAVKTAAAGRWPEILIHLGGIDPELLDGRRHHPCPRCGGVDRFRFIDEEAGACYCNQCFNRHNGDGIAALRWLNNDQEFGATLRLIGDHLGIDPPVEPSRSTRQRKPRKPPSGNIVAEYTYTDEKGNELFQAVRYDPKDFGQRHRGLDGEWANNIQGVRRVLYRLPALTALPPGSTIFVVEGEKDVHSLEFLGLTATCNPMGAKKWRPEYNEFFKGQHVVCIEDNDSDGRAHAKKVCAAVRGFAASGKILSLPGLPPKGDITDWLAAGGTKEQLLDLTGKQPPEWVHVPGGREIIVDKGTPVRRTLTNITGALADSGEVFTRADQLVDIRGGEIQARLTSAELAGLLSQHAEFLAVDSKGSEYKPLPANFANAWLHNRTERVKLPAISLFTRSPVYTSDWRIVQPGYDTATGIYYAGEPITPLSDYTYLTALLEGFCWKCPGDRTNYLSMLLTIVLISHFIGSKPLILFNGNQPSLGKSILAQIVAILRGDQEAETISFNPNDEEFEKRLGAAVRGGSTVIIIDNAKSTGKNQRIESACLERCVTDSILSFRLLGSSSTIRAENSHLFCITANSTEAGPDIVKRSVVVNLEHEGDPTHRQFTIEDPEGYTRRHRVAILGELLGMVEHWKASGMPMAKTTTRFNKKSWGNTVGGILEACGEPDFLANADEAATTMDRTRREFAELMSILANSPQGNWKPSELVAQCTKHRLLLTELGEGTARSLATKIGAIASRFVGEVFEVKLDSEQEPQRGTFAKDKDRTGTVYKIGLGDANLPHPSSNSYLFDPQYQESAEPAEPCGT